LAGAISIISTFAVLNIDKVSLEGEGKAVVEMHTEYSQDVVEDAKKINRALEKFEKFFGPKEIVQESNTEFKAIFMKGEN